MSSTLVTKCKTLILKTLLPYFGLLIFMQFCIKPLSGYVDVINALFQQNITEVVIRKSMIKLEEYDQSLKIEDVMQSLKDFGHSTLLLNDIENGLKNSSVFAQQCNEAINCRF